MTLGNDTLCNGGQAEIYFLSKKCLESRDAFDTYDCKPKVDTSSLENGACLAMVILGMIGGIAGNLMTLVAVPYAKRCNRYLHQAFFERLTGNHPQLNNYFSLF